VLALADDLAHLIGHQAGEFGFLRAQAFPDRLDDLCALFRAFMAPIEEGLVALPEGQQVMLKLSIPKEAGLYGGLTNHPKVLRVVALSGGYSTDDACRELAKNPGMIASFSRGLLQDLRATQDDAEFDATLSAAMDKIQAASVA